MDRKFEFAVGAMCTDSMFWSSHCLCHVLHPQPAGVLRASDRLCHSELVISVHPNLSRAAVQRETK